MNYPFHHENEWGILEICDDIDLTKISNGNDIIKNYLIIINLNIKTYFINIVLNDCQINCSITKAYKYARVICHKTNITNIEKKEEIFKGNIFSYDIIEIDNLYNDLIYFIYN
jgi:hypothetical protein